MSWRVFRAHGEAGPFFARSFTKYNDDTNDTTYHETNERS
jgi:hypothetical protein